MSLITRLDVLLVLGDFDRTGGGSLELVAWELLVTPEVLQAVWDEMAGGGAIAPDRADDVSGEMMFRLTSAGRRELRAADLRSQRDSG